MVFHTLHVGIISKVHSSEREVVAVGHRALALSGHKHGGLEEFSERDQRLGCVGGYCSAARVEKRVLRARYHTRGLLDAVVGGGLRSILFGLKEVNVGMIFKGFGRYFYLDGPGASGL